MTVVVSSIGRGLFKSVIRRLSVLRGQQGGISSAWTSAGERRRIDRKLDLRRRTRGVSAVTSGTRTATAMTSSQQQQQKKKKKKDKVFPQGALFKYGKEDYPKDALPCVDIGANLMDKAFENDVDEVMERASAAGLKAVVVTGTSVKASKAAIAFAEEKAKQQDKLGMFATVGVHPHDAKTCNDETRDVLRALASHPKCVAIGECGLDFDRNFSPQDVQREVFEMQIKLAKELGKPLFMHCRDAADDLCEIVKRNQPLGVEGVVHCFTGSMEEMRRFVDLGFHIGITGWICDDREGRSEELSAVVASVPEGKLMIETDAPYLTPRSIRPNKVRPWRNEPCLLPHVMSKVSEARGETMETLSEHALKTTQKFFGI